MNEWKLYCKYSDAETYECKPNEAITTYADINSEDGTVHICSRVKGLDNYSYDVPLIKLSIEDLEFILSKAKELTKNEL